jgi:hypothetical protein
MNILCSSYLKFSLHTIELLACTSLLDKLDDILGCAASLDSLTQVLRMLVFGYDDSEMERVASWVSLAVSDN